MTAVQERRASALLRMMAEDRYGQELADLTDANRKTLSRQIASLMRRKSRSVAARQRITVEGVRKVAQRVRNTPEVKTTYPVDLEPEVYAYIAHKHEMEGGTMKGIASAIIAAHRDRGG